MSDSTTYRAIPIEDEPLSRESASNLEEQLAQYVELRYLHKTILPTILSFLTQDYSFLWIKTLSDKTFKIQWLEATDTIGRMAERIEDQEGIKKETQRFIFAGKRLEHHKKHTKYGIYAGATIHMVLRLLGGAKGAREKASDRMLPPFEVICITNPTLPLPVDLRTEISNQVYRQPLYFPDTLCTMLHHISAEYGDFNELQMTQFQNGEEVLRNWVQTLRPGICEAFPNLFVPSDDLHIEGHFVRENDSTLNIIQEHRDSSDLTLQVCLFLKSSSGGMKFAGSSDSTIHVRHRVGQLVAWRGSVKHEVIPTQGERLSLVTFVSKRS